MPYPSAGFDGQFVYKRQDQRLWLSWRPFLVRCLLAKVNSLPLNSSILKDKTSVFRWRNLISPVQIAHPTHTRFKFLTKERQSNTRVLPGGNVEALIWLALYSGIDIVSYYGFHFHLDASERKPVDSISIRQMGAIEVQSIQFGLIAVFVPPGSLVASRALQVISVIVLIIRRKLHIAEMKFHVSSFLPCLDR